MESLMRKIIPSRIKEVKGKERVLEFIGSTELPDRDNEVIKASAWKFEQYVKNPVVQWAHNYSEPPIGRTLSIRQNQKKETIFEIEFAEKETYEFADTIFKLCKGGFLSATSVGFIPVEWQDGKKDTEPRRIYAKVELLEISIVPVPANPDALISARNTGVISMKEFEFVTKPEVTENYIRIPNPKAKGSHEGHKIRTDVLSKEKGIHGLYCVEDKQYITYLFEKEKWDKSKAEAWVKENAKAEHEPRLTSQDELRDNLEYTLSLVKTVGISEEMKELALNLSSEISRLTGGDTPVKIKSSPIRSMLEPVLKSLSAHHEAHNKCHESIMKALTSMCALDTSPELPDGDEDQTLVRSIVEETVNQILRRKEKC